MNLHSKALAVSLLVSGAAFGAQLEGVHVVDRDYLMIHVVDGEVTFKDDGKGDGAFTSKGTHRNPDKVIRSVLGTDVERLEKMWLKRMGK